MTIIRPDHDGHLILPDDFRSRRHYPDSLDFWLNEREDDIILHPRKPDVHKLYIEPTTGCNLECKTCIRNIWDDPNAAMKPEVFESILTSLARLPELRRVVFTGFGEPLTQPRILEMIQAVRERGLSVTVGTNGVLMTPDISEELVRLDVDRVIVSVDGVKPETYADIRGASLAKVLENVRGLNAAKSKLASLNPALGIEFVVLRSNIAELADLTKLATHLNAARVLVSNVLPYTQEMCDEVLYGYHPQEPFISPGFPVRIDSWVTWGNLELPRMHWGAERRCRFVGDRAMVIGWDGGVTPCYALSHNYSYFAIDRRKKQVKRYVLGNVREQELADIWMSEEYVKFRSEVRIFHFPSCPDCDLRETCDLREQNEGCWGWNPSCADCLWAQDIIHCP